MPERSRDAGDTPSGSSAAHRRWIGTDKILLVAAAGVLLWLVGDALLLITAALLLAVGLDGLATGVSQRTPLSRGWALAAVVALLMAVLALLVAMVLPQVVGQFDQLWQRIVAFVETVEEALAGQGLPEQLMGGEEGQQQLLEAAEAFAGPMASFTMAALGGIGSLIVLIAIALFAAANPGLYRRGLLKIVPPSRRERIDETRSAVAYALRWWFLGQLASMAMLGITVSLGLMVIGVDLWLSLGVITALLTFIPFLGPIIAGIPIVIVGFTEGVQIGLIVLVFYLIVQNIEGNFVVPMIQHKAVALPPALLISAQVLMGVLFGAMGLILAAPVTVIGMVLVQKLYVEDVLGEEVS